MTSENELTDKAAILARMAERYRALQSALAHVDDAALQRPGSWGDWSLKDLLAHLIYWQSSTIQRLQLYADGRIAEAAALAPADEAAMNVMNLGVYQANREQSPAEMRRVFATTYQALRTAAKSIPPEQYRDETLPLRAWLAGNSYEHYDEHLADINRALT